MRRVLGESRKERIEKRLKFISEMYELAFNIEGCNTTLLKLKTKINLANSEEDLRLCCKQLAEKIARLKNIKTNEKMQMVYLKVASRLEDVFNQVKNLISDEFRTIRNRNDRLLQIMGENL